MKRRRRVPARLLLLLLGSTIGCDSGPDHRAGVAADAFTLALDFLRSDLESRVGESRRPVVLMWHYGLRGWGLEKWWVPEDLEVLREVIAP